MERDIENWISFYMKSKWKEPNSIIIIQTGSHPKCCSETKKRCNEVENRRIEICGSSFSTSKWPVQKKNKHEVFEGPWLLPQVLVTVFLKIPLTVICTRRSRQNWRIQACIVEIILKCRCQRIGTYPMDKHGGFWATGLCSGSGRHGCIRLWKYKPCWSKVNIH